MLCKASPDLDAGSEETRESELLSARLTVARSGRHLALIAMRLRDVESLMVEAQRAAVQPDAESRRLRRSRLQTLDLLIQELAGLSDILVGVSEYLSDVPDKRLDIIVELPRLQSLSQALRDVEQSQTGSGTVLF